MTTILDLPNELLLFVAETLPLSNMRDLRLTCKRFHHILKRINRRRIVLYDIEHLVHLEDVFESLGDQFTNSLACKIVAASVLPPVSTASPSSSSSSSSSSRLSSSSFYDILAKAPSLHYLSLSLLPFSDVNISFVPPFDLSSSAPLCSITHLSIVNFRISQSFLAAFPCVVQVTLALVLEPEENAQMQLQYTPRDIISFISFTSTTSTPRTIERFTVTVTNITPDLVQVVAERFPKLTHLSFVWYPETDVAHGGVEITDASQILHEYIAALKPVHNTLRSLHLPLCIGGTSPLNADDEELGAGLVLSPERCRGLPSKRLQVRVSLFDTLDAAKRLTCGGVLPKLERIGWVLPQQGGPHMLVECLRGVDEPEPEPQPVEEATLESGCQETGAEENTEAPALGGFKLLPTPAFVFNPELLHIAKPVSLALPSSTLSVASTPLLRTPVRTPARTPTQTRPTTPIPVQLKMPRKTVPPPPPKERKLTDKWTLSMHWPVGHSWPPAEIEDVFPVGEVVREVYN